MNVGAVVEVVDENDGDSRGGETKGECPSRGLIVGAGLAVLAYSKAKALFPFPSRATPAPRSCLLGPC
jgi:hypothetical protein